MGASRERGTVRSFDGDWTATGSLASARNTYTMTQLASGKVWSLAAALVTPPTYLANAELYDPAAGAWSPLVR